MKHTCAVLAIFSILIVETVSAQYIPNKAANPPKSTNEHLTVSPSDVVPLELDPFWQSVETDVYSTGLTLWDCNNDGYIDVFISNGNDMALAPNYIYLSRSGTLPAQASWISSNAEYSGHCAVGDLDHNGFPDFIVANYLGAGRFGTGNYPNMYSNAYGLPSPSPDWYSADTMNSFSCALGDMDNDGDLDLAIATGDPYGPVLSAQLVYRNVGGTLEMTPFWQSTTSMAALDVAWGDVDNDGYLDLAVCSGLGGTSLFRNLGGTLETTPSWTSFNQDPANTIVFGDISGDGWLDLIVACNFQGGGEGTYIAYLNDGAGHLAAVPGWTSASGGYGSALSLYDYDQDGDLDLAAGRWWNRTLVFENLGTTLSQDPVWQSNPNTVVEELSWADIDGEGLEMYADTFAADGKRLHYLKRIPIQAIDSVSVDGAVLPVSGYSFQPQDGWISTAVDASVRTIVYYSYSTTCDLVESNWDVANMAFANTRLPNLRMYADTTFGWAPLEVQFADSSVGAVSWLWRFGDGDSSMSQNPTHVYSSPGSFGVYHGAQLPDRFHQRYQNNMVTVLADTLVGDTVNTSPGEHVELDVYARNSIPIRQITLPVEYSGSLGLTIDSFSISGCRTETFEVATYLHYDPWNKRVTIKLQASAVEGEAPDLPAGSGTVAKLFFTVDPSAAAGVSTPVVIDGYESYQPTFRSSQLSFFPKLVPGLITAGSCCIGMRGNIDASSDESVDISDLIYLVEYSFSDGTEPPCLEEADVNGDGAVDIADVIYMVDFSFGDGPAPVACP
jgi:hypothetical protein